MRTDSADDEDLLNPGARRLREKERQRVARAAAAREAIRQSGVNPPDDLAAPSEDWRRQLGDAVDSLLLAEWPDDQTWPDGVASMLLSATDQGFQVDTVLHLLPTGTRQLRLEFDAHGECVIRVAVASEPSAASKRLDPRGPMRWAFAISTKGMPA